MKLPDPVISPDMANVVVAFCTPIAPPPPFAYRPATVAPRSVLVLPPVYSSVPRVFVGPLPPRRRLAGALDDEPIGLAAPPLAIAPTATVALPRILVAPE